MQLLPVHWPQVERWKNWEEMLPLAASVPSSAWPTLVKAILQGDRAGEVHSEYEAAVSPPTISEKAGSSKIFF